MAATKVYDIAVKTGEYTNQQGETKGRWQNVGAVMKGDDGSSYIMLAKWFNPAGVPDLKGGNAGKEAVLLSLFAPKDKDGAAQSAPAARPAAAPRTVDDLSDDIPF